MKKLTDKYKKWLLHRARNEENRTSGSRREPKRTSRPRHIVTGWFGDRIERLIAINAPICPPSNICFSTNGDESVEFLNNWRNRFRSIQQFTSPSGSSWTQEPRKPRGLRQISSYYDFSSIENLSTAAALILTAEYDRVASIIRSVPPAINLNDWHPAVFKKLYEIGFFEIVGLAKDVADRYRTDGDVRSMRIFSGSNATDLDIASDAILELSKFVDTEGPLTEDVTLALNNALSEAMINVAKHAYPDDHDFRYKHVDKWWVTASADKGSRELTIVIYDQGASIPVTFPRKDFSERVASFLKETISLTPKFDFQNDSVYIEGAMRPGKSQTNQKHRGLGLPEMKDLIDICGDGSLIIISRGGECKYVPNKPISKKSRPHSIGGTLIEWTLRLPEKTNNG